MQARGGTVVARSTKDASAAQPVSNGLLAFVQKSMAGAGAAVMLLNGPAPSFAEEFEVSAAQTTFEGTSPSAHADAIARLSGPVLWACSLLCPTAWYHINHFAYMFHRVFLVCLLAS